MSRASTDIDHRASEQIFRFILFVCGDEPNSAEARNNLDRLCATHIPGHCETQIVDVLDDYRTALEHSILVTPCLLKLEPEPRALVAGTLSDTDTVRTALQLPRR